METGVEMIADERQLKQIEKHGFTAEHHAMHPEWYGNGQLIDAANMISAYDEKELGNQVYRTICPLNWDLVWWQKLCDKPQIERLAIAGAFLAAEIDRLNFISRNFIEINDDLENLPKYSGVYLWQSKETGNMIEYKYPHDIIQKEDFSLLFSQYIKKK